METADEVTGLESLFHVDNIDFGNLDVATFLWT